MESRKLGSSDFEALIRVMRREGFGFDMDLATQVYTVAHVKGGSMRPGAVMRHAEVRTHRELFDFRESIIGSAPEDWPDLRKPRAWHGEVAAMREEGFTFTRQSKSRGYVSVSYSKGGVSSKKDVRILENRDFEAKLLEVRAKLMRKVEEGLTPTRNIAGMKKRKSELEMMMRADSWHGKSGLHNEYMAIVSELEKDQKSVGVSPRRSGKSAAMTARYGERSSPDDRVVSVETIAEMYSNLATPQFLKGSGSELGPGRIPPTPRGVSPTGRLKRPFSSVQLPWYSMDEAHAIKHNPTVLLGGMQPGRTVVHSHSRSLGEWLEPSAYEKLEQRTEKWLQPAREKIKAMIPEWRTV